MSTPRNIPTIVPRKELYLSIRNYVQKSVNVTTGGVLSGSYPPCHQQTKPSSTTTLGRENWSCYAFHQSRAISWQCSHRGGKGARIMLSHPANPPQNKNKMMTQTVLPPVYCITCTKLAFLNNNKTIASKWNWACFGQAKTIGSNGKTWSISLYLFAHCGSMSLCSLSPALCDWHENDRSHLDLI